MPYVLGAFLLIFSAATATGIAVAAGGRGTKGTFDYLLVLGTKVVGEQPGKMLRDRINGAYTYLAANPQVICIVSGYKSGVGTISEAECMKRELVAMGIEEERIWLEPNASSTKENLEYAMKLIHEKNGTRPEVLGILSSEHHLLRARLLASKQKIRCATVPAKTTDLKTFVVNFLREIPLIWYYCVAD